MKLTVRERIALFINPAYSRLHLLVKDLESQVKALHSTGAIDPDEVRALREMQKSHTLLFNREQEISLWYREFFKEEIANGYTAGKSMLEVIQAHCRKENR
jgi:hypothetical protein